MVDAPTETPPPSRCRALIFVSGLSALWLAFGTLNAHAARARDVENYEKSVVYVCVHWADGLPLMPRQSPDKCYRKHVIGNPVRRNFEESGWWQDAVVAAMPLAAAWLIGLLIWGMIALRRNLLAK